jgi:nucleotide-binding universal stress UspA family protein
MNTRPTGRIVVATSGSRASRSAITYAAREAAARGLPLEIVHVVMPTIVAGPYAASPGAAVREAGRALLVLGETLAREVALHLEISTRLLTGSRADALVRHTEDADLLVLGAFPHDLAERVWTGSTVMGVAARASCPVVLVPEGEPRGPRHEILVGLKSTEGADHLLATAFALASHTQSELRIVHAWTMESPYDEAIAERVPAPAWETDEVREIEGALIDLRMAYPEVQVGVHVLHGRAGILLAGASHDSDLVMISRPAHGGAVHHLGATARAVVRQAECPVMVVPPRGVFPDVRHEHVQTAAMP